jgi:ABC-type sugar transport system permease subunit
VHRHRNDELPFLSPGVRHHEIGYSSAVTVVMLLLVAAISLGLVWTGRKREAMA